MLLFRVVQVKLFMEGDFFFFLLQLLLISVTVNDY